MSHKNKVWVKASAAEHFEEDGDKKGKDRPEHPIVQPQGTIDLSEPLIDIRSEFRDLLIELLVKMRDVVPKLLVKMRNVAPNLCELTFHVRYSAGGGSRLRLAGSCFNQGIV